MTTAKIIADSMNVRGERITTFVLTYPRIIHSELMTHRLFSRNSSSSRAQNSNRTIENIKSNLFIPIAYQKEHKGMQGTEYFDEPIEEMLLDEIWKEAANNAINSANKLIEFGVTKQIANRLLEPFMYQSTVVTSTDWDNFFELRLPRFTEDNDLSYKDKLILGQNLGEAEIHISELAMLMKNEMDSSVPTKLLPGEWHIPFKQTVPLDVYTEGEVLQTELKLAVVQCARISYIGKNTDLDSSLNLFNRLLTNKHMSAFEHVARSPMDSDMKHTCNGKFANLNGWVSYRFLIENNLL